LALAEMTEAMNRGWADKDSRIAMLPQLERSGVSVAVEPQRIKAALERDPPFKG
jgi:3-hydroxyisobutyrate dehydrogenase